MSMEPRIGPDGRDDDLTRELRSIYAAPQAAAYWRGLEARILAGLPAERGMSDVWWSPLARWARPGAAVAAAGLLVAAAALWQAREAREDSAIATAMLQANSPTAQVTAAAGTTPDNETVLRYVLTP